MKSRPIPLIIELVVYARLLLSTGRMLKSRSIRAVVNLCVTGAILAPAAGFVGSARDECGKRVASIATCPGCGCCAVAHTDERCGCCNHAEPLRESRVATNKAECCSDDSGKEAAKSSAASQNICMCGNADREPAVPPAEERSATEQLVRTILVGSPMMVWGGSDLPTFDSSREIVLASLSSSPRRPTATWRLADLIPVATGARLSRGS